MISVSMASYSAPVTSAEEASTPCPSPLELAGCCGSTSAGVGSSLASSGGMGTAAGVGAGTAAVDVEPESWTGGLGASEGGGEAAAAAGFALDTITTTKFFS